MKYSDGQVAHLWDRVEVWPGCRGVVIAAIDANEYPDETAAWAYLGTGVMIDTEQAGLVHFSEPDEEIQLVARGGTPDEEEWAALRAAGVEYSKRIHTFVSGSRPTVQVGYVNRHGQRCGGHRGVTGTDHGQYAYRVECTFCGHVYGANGSDMHLRRCPSCQGGAKGLAF